MTTFDLSQLENIGTEFVRNVLRNNLTDPESRSSKWIFKSMPENRTFDPPFVIIDSEKTTTKNVFDNVKGSLIIFSIEVWADKLYNRDMLADSISEVLRNKNSSDGDGDSMSDNKLSLSSINTSINDAEDLNGNTVRRKFLDIEMNYGGS